MKLFVTGATGVLGRRAVPLLIEAGHQVTAVARTAEKAKVVRSQGAEPVTVDLFDAAAVHAAVAGHEGVLNLATHIPPMNESMKPKAWLENDRIRTEASVHLVDAALAAGAELFVQESITFPYPDRGDTWIDETVPVEAPAALAAAPAAEAQAARFTAEAGSRGARGVVLRFGSFYGPDASHTSEMADVARRGFAPLLGPKAAYQSFIHLDDAASAVAAAVDLPSGTYNVVDDEPLPKAEVAAVMAEVAGRRRLRWTVARLSRFGGSKTEALRRSQRVSNRKLRSFGWLPSVTSVSVGWPTVVAEIRRTDPSPTRDIPSDEGGHRDAA